jgi:putative transposase
VGKNPTDRGNKGTKKSLVVDGDGGPLGAVIEAANVPDQKRLRATLEAIVVERPESTAEQPQHLCLEGGYNNPTGKEAAAEAQYTPHLQPGWKQKEACDRSKGHKPRRWVVERTWAWLSKCRGILVRYDKKDENYLGLLQLACALFWYRRLDRLGDVGANQGRSSSS